MRLAAPLAILALLGALLTGCGGSSSTSGGESQGRSAPGGGSTVPREGAAKAPVGASARSCALDAGGATGLRATGVSCGEAQKVALAWGRRGACTLHSGASRASCDVGRYRCLGTRADRGVAVSCSGPGRSVAFLFRRS